MVSSLQAGEKYYLPSCPDHESDLGLSVNIEVTGLLGGTLGIDDSLVGIFVLFVVLDCVVVGSLSGGSTSNLVSVALIGQHLEMLSVSLLLLEDVLWDCLCPKTKHTRKYDVSQPAQEQTAQLLRQEKRGRQVSIFLDV